MVVEVASGTAPAVPLSDRAVYSLTALASSCLIALSVARGEAELILNAVACLIMSASALSEQDLQVSV